jgi:murein DD-endopeptidase MepM/ murein hydrolase activator NlpD
MKSIFCLILVSFTISAFAQSNPTLEDANKLLELFENMEPIDIAYVEEKNSFDITSLNWDTNNVKVDYKEEVNLPLKIEFTDSVYVSPISKNKVITSRYGWRWGRAHRGIDIDLVTGDSLFAMFDGVVRFADYSSGHGRTVVVRHYNGLETLYAHLSRYAVKPNDSVKAGDYLGKGGASGNARGSHLHLEITYNGIHINPEYLLSFDEENTINARELWVTSKWTRPELHSSKRKAKIEILTTEEELDSYLNRPAEVYTVRKGDSLSKISAKNNVSIAALCKTNGIRKNSTLRIGQKLVIEQAL